MSLYVEAGGQVSLATTPRLHPPNNNNYNNKGSTLRAKQQAMLHIQDYMRGAMPPLQQPPSEKSDIAPPHSIPVRVISREAEIEARMHAVEAESQALKREAAENAQNQLSLRQELATLKVPHMPCLCEQHVSFHPSIHVGTIAFFPALDSQRAEPIFAAVRMLPAVNEL